MEITKIIKDIRKTIFSFLQKKELKNLRTISKQFKSEIESQTPKFEVGKTYDIYQIMSIIDANTKHVVVYNHDYQEVTFVHVDKIVNYVIDLDEKFDVSHRSFYNRDAIKVVEIFMGQYIAMINNEKTEFLKVKILNSSSLNL